MNSSLPFAQGPSQEAHEGLRQLEQEGAHRGPPRAIEAGLQKGPAQSPGNRLHLRDDQPPLLQVFLGKAPQGLPAQTLGVNILKSLNTL